MKKKVQEKLKELIDEAERNIQELLSSERKIKEFGIDLFSASIRERFEQTLERAKDIRKFYVKQLGKLDRAKRELEDTE